MDDLEVKISMLNLESQGPAESWRRAKSLEAKRATRGPPVCFCTNPGNLTPPSGSCYPQPQQPQLQSDSWMHNNLPYATEKKKKDEKKGRNYLKTLERSGLVVRTQQEAKQITKNEPQKSDEDFDSGHRPPRHNSQMKGRKKLQWQWLANAPKAMVPKSMRTQQEAKQITKNEPQKSDEDFDSGHRPPRHNSQMKGRKKLQWQWLANAPKAMVPKSMRTQQEAKQITKNEPQKSDEDFDSGHRPPRHNSQMKGRKKLQWQWLANAPKAMVPKS
ncbi:uncharacterized protein LOC129144671, partial [Talpa occidentalis]|uniref:uncharacterized protein LOC129144671 n=1 Tax=Talpa occidentalis TaxID=50954 RepID=UPI0023F62831